MEQLTEEHKLIGKTITRFITKYGDENNKIFLIFDKEFAILEGTGWDDNQIRFCSERINTIANEYNCAILSDIGIISEKEAKRVISDYHKKNNDLKEKNELKKLAELRAKYPKHI